MDDSLRVFGELPAAGRLSQDDLQVELREEFRGQEAHLHQRPAGAHDAHLPVAVARRLGGEELP